ncbi:xylulokinase [Flavilitoribacter nigricans]|uniref:Carbohydrate kinase n=1 Tax=Flavilitoribacter nigricans (strain ATCC 23147 / DSM 23189 / NBRC 102662 / NCIMB 1420 / SS-2) TaxID=1122177 RepID=A0A2D0N6J2_FLAN2|nr:FGGY family carbohydrate kinase [Flavilitoribacter nigricans]PHN04008.1 carbohydrate kinase [Flavilitoribacter nigricans DSM 23189 = NBRC 102662]
MYLIGYDIGSSSIKAAIIEVASGRQIAVRQEPEREMEMIAKQSGWAEQDPESWWQHVCTATAKLLQQTGIDPAAIQGIGIAYQMHGLVVVDDQHRVLRPSIIWCDSRAVEIGNQAFDRIGHERSLNCLLNSPGNFTASKLKWVQENEPELYARIHKIMLPGDYIAMKLTGTVNTTISGLSEGIFWDFKANDVAQIVLEDYGISSSLIPDIVPTFGDQGRMNAAGAAATGLKVGTPVCYRAGDQPNNALALNVLNPGEVAATGGTSGVVYGVVDKAVSDPFSRVNGFAHVNYTQEDPRIGVLLCINGAGSQYGWMRHQVAPADVDYYEMEKAAAGVSVGSEGLHILPFGNGAERVLQNINLGAHIHGLEFNRHNRAHCYRAALEGVAFSFVYGGEILHQMGLRTDIMRVGNDNMFRSQIFSETIATLLNCEIEVLETTGAIGAARGAGYGAGVYNSLDEAMGSLERIKVYRPLANTEAYRDAYAIWRQALEKKLAEYSAVEV